MARRCAAGAVRGRGRRRARDQAAPRADPRGGERHYPQPARRRRWTSTSVSPMDANVIVFPECRPKLISTIASPRG